MTLQRLIEPIAFAYSKMSVEVLCLSKTYFCLRFWIRLTLLVRKLH